MTGQVLAQKIHRFQLRPGWCGPAVIQMALLAGGIQKTQEEISKDVNIPWWGTNHDTMIAYLSRFYSKVDYKEKSNLSDLTEKLDAGLLVIVNWWDDLSGDDQPEGHYSIVTGYDKNTKMLTIVDPSNERGGIWQIEASDFRKRWYDFADVHNKKRVFGWMLWVDPNSKIQKSVD